MRRRALETIGIMIVLFAVIQLVRPARTNPAVDSNRTLQAHIAASHPAVPVIVRACRDCHSDETAWPWYSHVAPVSWWLTRHVTQARAAVNFSSWAGYAPERQRKLLRESCEQVREREMPLSAYVLLHPEGKLTAGEVRAICDLAPTD
jgi:hypothetical protein